MFLRIKRISLLNLTCALVVSVPVSKTEQENAGTGLLSGLAVTPANMRNHKFYSSHVDVNAANNFVGNPHRLHDVVQSQFGALAPLHMRHLATGAARFAKRSEFYDRHELVHYMNNIVHNPNQEGSFVCVLGGKSTGKSKFVNYLAATHPGQVVTIDCRRNPNISENLMDTLLAGSATSGKWDATIIVLSGLMQDLYPLAAHTAAAVADTVTRSKDVLKKSPTPPLETLIYALSCNGSFVTLIIDEANAALSGDGSDAAVNTTKQTLSLFTRLTKQEQKVNVVLVSSEHTFPFKLNNKKFGFNTLDLGGKVLYAGEVPPNEMYSLLVDRLGTPHELAVALIATFGGHIRDVVDALVALELGKYDARGKVAIKYNPQLTSSVLKCLEWTGASPATSAADQERMRLVLRQLAETGFAHLHSDSDQVAEVIASTGVGGLVSAASPLIVGLDPMVWDDPHAIYGLVPSKQSMRLVIAEALAKEMQK